MYLFERFVEKIESLIVAKEDCFWGGNWEIRRGLMENVNVHHTFRTMIVGFPSAFCFFYIL